MADPIARPAPRRFPSYRSLQEWKARAAYADRTRRSSTRAAPRAARRIPDRCAAFLQRAHGKSRSVLLFSRGCCVWAVSLDASLRGFAIAGRSRGGASSADDGAWIEEAAREFRDGDAQLSPQAALQAAIILRAAEDVANQITKCGRVIHQLHHARGDGAAEEISAKHFSGNVGGEFQVRGESSSQFRWIKFGLACRDGLRQQITRAQRVI